jgi:hypothetical protein
MQRDAVDLRRQDEGVDKSLARCLETLCTLCPGNAALECTHRNVAFVLTF